METTSCSNAATRSDSSFTGPCASHAANDGRSVQAKMSDAVRENAFVNAWPGSGVPKVAHCRAAHGA